MSRRHSYVEPRRNGNQIDRSNIQSANDTTPVSVATVTNPATRIANKALAKARLRVNRFRYNHPESLRWPYSIRGVVSQTIAQCDHGALHPNIPRGFACTSRALDCPSV